SVNRLQIQCFTPRAVSSGGKPRKKRHDAPFLYARARSLPGSLPSAQRGKKRKRKKGQVRALQKLTGSREPASLSTCPGTGWHSRRPVVYGYSSAFSRRPPCSASTALAAGYYDDRSCTCSNGPLINSTTSILRVYSASSTASGSSKRWLDDQSRHQNPARLVRPRRHSLGPVTEVRSRHRT
ncbi:hypothetical protein LX36DRAFT_701834, partial [Colletotrichum falcatum]